MMRLPGHLAKTNKVSARAKKFRDKLRRAQGRGGTQKRMKNECPVDSRLLFPVMTDQGRQAGILMWKHFLLIMTCRFKVILTNCRGTSISIETSKQFSYVLGMIPRNEEYLLLVSPLSTINMIWWLFGSISPKTWRGSSNKPLSIFSSKEGEGNFPSFPVSQTRQNSDEWVARYPWWSFKEVLVTLRALGCDPHW